MFFPFFLFFFFFPPQSLSFTSSSSSFLFFLFFFFFLYLGVDVTLIIAGWFLRSMFENSAKSPVKLLGTDFWIASSILWLSRSYSSYRRKRQTNLHINCRQRSHRCPISQLKNAILFQINYLQIDLLNNVINRLTFEFFFINL